MASIHALRNAKDAALEWLQRAYERGWRQPSSTKLNPTLASLRGEPRFEQFIQRMTGDLARAGRNSAAIAELREKTIPNIVPVARK